MIILNRSYLYNCIEEKLQFLSFHIQNRGKMNLLDLNIQAEVFFMKFINLLMDYELINMNAIEQNAAGIDLIDYKNKIIVQVSSTCTSEKISKSLSKNQLRIYEGYQFIFIAICGEASKLRNKEYENAYSLNFNPKSDIYDLNSLLQSIMNLNIDKQQKIFEFIKMEMQMQFDMVKIDSNLTSIINILAKEDLSIFEALEINEFEIERKIEFNQLLRMKYIIDDYKVFYSKLDEKYTEFDLLGVNKSRSVLNKIRKEYVNILVDDKKPHEVFLLIIDRIINIIRESANYSPMTIEELEMCVSIIVVDAFIRCKIFENPERYDYAITR